MGHRTTAPLFQENFSLHGISATLAPRHLILAPPATFGGKIFYCATEPVFSKHYHPKLFTKCTCLLSDVARLLSHVSLLLSLVSCLLTPVPCPMSHVSCLTSLVSCLLSHASCLKSPVTCLLSHISPAVSHADLLDDSADLAALNLEVVLYSPSGGQILSSPLSSPPPPLLVASLTPLRPAAILHPCCQPTSPLSTQQTSSNPADTQPHPSPQGSSSTTPAGGQIHPFPPVVVLHLCWQSNSPLALSDHTVLKLKVCGFSVIWYGV